jgi:hypothetical protein
MVVLGESLQWTHVWKKSSECEDWLPAVEYTWKETMTLSVVVNHGKVD